jgi:hypothetical protein
MVETGVKGLACDRLFPEVMGLAKMSASVSQPPVLEARLRYSFIFASHYAQNRECKFVIKAHLHLQIMAFYKNVKLRNRMMKFYLKYHVKYFMQTHISFYIIILSFKASKHTG